MAQDLLQLTCHGAQISGQTILSARSLTLPQGKFIAVLGRNGAGKTTLLECLVGINRWGTADIELAGQKIVPEQRSKLISWIPEGGLADYANFTVYEMLMLGRFPHHHGRPTAIDHRLTIETLHRFELFNYRRRVVNSLSSGERQRAVVARGVNNDSKLLLVDEPCVHLDGGQELQMVSLLRELSTNQQKTVIAAMHNLNYVINYCDLAIVIIEQQIKAFFDLGKEAKVIADHLGLPASGAFAPS